MEIAVTAGPKLDGGDLLHVGELPLCRLSHGCQSIRRRLVVPARDDATHQSLDGAPRKTGVALTQLCDHGVEIIVHGCRHRPGAPCASISRVRVGRCPERRFRLTVAQAVPRVTASRARSTPPAAALPRPADSRGAPVRGCRSERFCGPPLQCTERDPIVALGRRTEDARQEMPDGRCSTAGRAPAAPSWRHPTPETAPGLRPYSAQCHGTGLFR